MSANGSYALVVDDDPLILMHASDIIEDAGFRPLMAHCSAVALKILEEQAPNVTLLFTDVEMDGEHDGFHLARQTAACWPDIRILVASGHRSPGVGDLPEGAVFVSKPFSADIVYQRLHELLPDHRKPSPLKMR